MKIRRFVSAKWAHDGDAAISSHFLVSSIRVEVGSGHDRVSVWNRGGKAGDLVLVTGDGVAFAIRLLGQDCVELDEEGRPV